MSSISEQSRQIEKKVLPIKCISVGDNIKQHYVGEILWSYQTWRVSSFLPNRGKNIRVDFFV